MDELLSRLLKKTNPKDRKSLESTSGFACDHLAAIPRNSGEDYARHGLEVAATLLELTQDTSLLRVAMLHDLLVHPDGERLAYSANLTPKEQRLVWQMHELRKLHIDKNTKELDQVLNAFTEDTRLIFLRMAHRVNDIRHIDRFNKVRKIQIARESLHIYGPIAGRLGLQSWRREIEDACFLILYPGAAKNLQRQFDDSRTLDLACLRHAKKYLSEKLREKQISFTIDYRLKSLYSTYRKMLLKKRQFHELTDRLALRVVVKSTDDCYRALGVVHGSMHPIPGKLKDYIGAPKENNYRSIHTVVFPLPGVSEQPIEIQIRTSDMDEEAEVGIAAHEMYKKVNYSLDHNRTRVNLFRNLEILRQESGSPKQFEQALRHYFNEARVLIFDQQNNLYHINKPATALDFVCFVHKERAIKLKNILINGRPRPLGTSLNDGDTLHAQFGLKKTATSVWLEATQHKGNRAMIRRLV